MVGTNERDKSSAFIGSIEVGFVNTGIDIESCCDIKCGVICEFAISEELFGFWVVSEVIGIIF
jgi:hypothetical protein